MTLKFYVDAAVIVAYLALIMGIGLWFSRGNKNVNDFALGGRSIPWWGVLASILAAEISAATFLGAPESGFKERSWIYAQFAIGTILARIIVSFLFIPTFYRHGVVSLYEFLETRFGHTTRKFASGTFLLTRCLARGTRRYVAAIVVVLAFEAMQGRVASKDEKFMLFAVALVIITILTAFYTTAGGIKAVVWTDFIQILILISSVGFSVWFLISQIPGGWAKVGENLKQPYFFNFARPEDGNIGMWIKNILTQEYTIWAAIIGSTFVTMATHGIDQDTVQRMLTAKNRRQSAFATIMSGLLDLPIVGCFILIGILLYTYYQVNPDSGLPSDTREVFPYFIIHKMPAGLSGLVIAGILSTAMGSLSTALNALGTSAAEDFVFPRLKAGATDKKRISILRWCTVFFALMIILVGLGTAWFMAHNPDTPIIPLVLGILGFTFGSLLGIFLLAILTKTRGCDAGNITAMLAGFGAVLFMSNPFNIQGFFGFKFVLAFPWRITLGTFVTFGVAMLFRTPASKIQSAADHDLTLEPK